MRTFKTILSLFLAAASFQLYAQQVTIKKIGATDKSAGFFVEVYGVPGKILYKSLKFDTTGKVLLESPKVAQLYWIENQPFYLFPNDAIEITLPERKSGAMLITESSSAASGLKVSGKHAAENLLINNIYQEWSTYSKNFGQDTTIAAVKGIVQTEQKIDQLIYTSTKDKELQALANYVKLVRSLEIRLLYLIRTTKPPVDKSFYAVADQINLSDAHLNVFKDISIRGFLANYYKFIKLKEGADKNDYALIDNGSSVRMIYFLNHSNNQRVLAAVVGQGIIYHLSNLGLDDELQKTIALARTKITNQEVLNTINTNERNYKAVAARAVAPAFELPDAKGKMHSLADYRGQFVAIDVWATWCIPCMQSLPKFLALREKYKGNKNIEFISISIDDKNAQSKWLAFLKSKNMNGMDLHASAGRSSGFEKDYVITGIPRYILIDKAGKIIASHAPSASEPEYVSLIESILK